MTPRRAQAAKLEADGAIEPEELDGSDASGDTGPVLPPARPKTVRRSQLSDEVASYVRDLIMAGHLRQGQFVRLEHLAEELKISPTPVREGLLALRGEGFVQLEPRRGFVVCPLSRGDVSDLYLLQGSIAGELAARAASNITAAEVDHLAKLQAQLEATASAGDIDGIEETNHAFHRSINLVAKSPKLALMLSTVFRYAPRRFYASIDGWQQASVDDHRSIMKALYHGSPDEARSAMQQHIEHAGVLLINHLEGAGFWSDDVDHQTQQATPKQADLFGSH